MTKSEPEIMEILQVPHPLLRQKAKPVRKINRTIRQLLDRMAATMYDADGVGLAAPQVGVMLRMFVVDVGDGLVELINPEIVRKEGSESGFEGCLSIPGYIGEVERAKHVQVTGLDRHGRRVYFDASDFFARAIQHEYDHLDGILYTDKAKRIVEIPPETRLRILFMGTPDFASVVLSHMVEHGCRPIAVVTQPDRPRGRGKRLQASPVKKLAQDLDIPVLQPESLKQDEDFHEYVKELDVDVIVTAAYGQILPPELLELPKLAAINVHASLLPAYRGAAPIQRALMDGRKETGITIMHMARELDAGDVILQKKIEITPEDNAGTLHDKLAELGGSAVCEALHLLAKGEAERVPQDERQATYAARIQADEEWIDWQESNEAISRKIRALTPWPGAKTRLDDRIIQIVDAVVAEPETRSEREPLPGELFITTGRNLLVRCGEGYLEVRKLKPAGANTMSAVDFLNGWALRGGERFA